MDGRAICWGANDYSQSSPPKNTTFATSTLHKPIDTDNDGIPDITDTDDGGDNVPDFIDAFPLIYGHQEIWYWQLLAGDK